MTKLQTTLAQNNIVIYGHRHYYSTWNDFFKDAELYSKKR